MQERKYTAYSQFVIPNYNSTHIPECLGAFTQLTNRYSEGSYAGIQEAQQFGITNIFESNEWVEHQDTALKKTM